jgi:hypothetical protein
MTVHQVELAGGLNCKIVNVNTIHILDLLLNLLKLKTYLIYLMEQLDTVMSLKLTIVIF